jgi:HD superfamily phosphohydrolase
MKESNARVVVGGVVQRLEEASGLVGAIRNAQRSAWRLGVYALESDQEAVASAAVDVLGLPDRVRA